MEDIVIIGGGAKSPLWCQIVSDIFGLEVKMPQNAESSFGGALWLVLVWGHLPMS